MAIQSFQPYLNWTTCFHRYPAFADLLNLTPLPEWITWPTLQQLQQLLITQKLPYQFIDQQQLQHELSIGYEAYIVQTQQIPVRLNNWHDLFGSLIWSLFPKTKRALNKGHTQTSTITRSPYRDALTHFDECGVVVITTNERLITQLQRHEWQAAFIEQREQWQTQTKVMIFGHASYELLTKPYLGLTAKMLTILIDEHWLKQPLYEQYQWVDRYLALRIPQLNKQQLSPLPLLGIPGWDQQNQNPSYYANQAYFRPLRGQQYARS